ITFWSIIDAELENESRPMAGTTSSVKVRTADGHRTMDQILRRKPTISDVARWAGTSTATVSRALAAPEKVTETTRKLVIAAVRKTGYVLNLAARNLRTNKTRTILAVLLDFSNVFFSRILRGISDTLVSTGY